MERGEIEHEIHSTEFGYSKINMGITIFMIVMRKMKKKCISQLKRN